MNDFSSDWLALREPLDTQARSLTLTQNLQSWRANRNRLNIVDLGAGTGANLRYLAPALGGDQDWLLLDHSTELLEHAQERVCAWAIQLGMTVERDGKTLSIKSLNDEYRVTSRVLDLAYQLKELDLSTTHLVTGSALLDLVSENWLETLAKACTAAASTVFFALSYEGRIGWEPGTLYDDTITALVNRHQLTDKGFGPALGPGAAGRLAEMLIACGYSVETTRSDWQIDPSREELQRALALGWSAAAAKMEPNQKALIAGWLAGRLKLIADGASSLRVGHRDLFACGCVC